MAAVSLAALVTVAAAGYGPGRTIDLHKHVTLQATRSRWDSHHFDDSCFQLDTICVIFLANELCARFS